MSIVKIIRKPVVPAPAPEIESIQLDLTLDQAKILANYLGQSGYDTVLSPVYTALKGIPEVAAGYYERGRVLARCIELRHQLPRRADIDEMLGVKS